MTLAQRRAWGQEEWSLWAQLVDVEVAFIRFYEVGESKAVMRRGGGKDGKRGE